MNKFEEVYEQCKESVDNELAAQTKFVVEIKKVDKDVSLIDVRKFLGFYDEDPKKDAAESQKFRNKILHPVRNHITKMILNSTGDETDVDIVWSRDSAESFKDLREKVNNYLPRLTRQRASLNLNAIIQVDI